MKMNFKGFLCSMIILCGLILVPAFSSSAYLPVGVFSADLSNSNYVSQLHSCWCWAAAAENLTIAEGEHYLNQTYAVLAIKGVDENGNPKDVPGSIADCAHAAEYISLNHLDYLSDNTVKSYYFICDNIYNGHPIVAGGTCYDNNGNPLGSHAVMLMGWDNNYNSQLVKYHDSLYMNYTNGSPYYNTRYHVCTYNAFCNGTYNDRIYDCTAYLNWN